MKFKDMRNGKPHTFCLFPRAGPDGEEENLLPLQGIGPLFPDRSSRILGSTRVGTLIVATIYLQLI